MPNPKSTLAIAGHPVHVMLVPFPIAFYVGALACDIAYASLLDPSWADAAMWLLGAGLVTHALAAVAGAVDFWSEPRIRAINEAWLHMIGNIALAVLQLYNWYHHYAFGADGVVPVALILSIAAVALLLFNGWLGWTLVQTHRVGVSEEPRDRGFVPADRRDMRPTA